MFTSFRIPLRVLTIATGVFSLALAGLPIASVKLVAAEPNVLNADDTPSADSPRASNRPNIVLIVVDDLGYGEPGCYGGDLPTSNIDDLAADGVRFTRGYVTAPFCAASRAGLMTGRLQTRFGFEFNPIGAQNEDPRIGLPTGEHTVADFLKNAGYATALVGKWHLGGTAAYHPQRRGFDDFFGFLHEGHYFVQPPFAEVTTWLRRRSLPDGGAGRWTSDDGTLVLSTHMGHNEPPYDASNPLLRSSQPVREDRYLTDAFTAEACEFINRNANRPFFVAVTYNAVHSPMQARQDDLRRFAEISDIQRRIFSGMLWRFDLGVGRIRDALREHGLEENTLVILISDNGGPTKELTSSNAPLRGGKGDLYEGGVRVPFVIAWPGNLPAGKTVDDAVTALDILPTVLAAAKIKTPPRLDGVDLLPYLTGANGDAPHDSLFWRVGNKAAYCQGDWKIIRQTGNWELYNLADDIDESHNLAAEQPERLRAMTRAWESQNAEMVNPLW